MRRIGVALAGIFALVVLSATWLQAGDYHRGATLFCNECHVMHGEQSHSYEPNSSGNYTGIGSSAPYVYLLRNDLNELCLTCHDGKVWAPDVFEANAGSNVRQAGALNEVGGLTPYFEATGHTLGTTDTPPGGTWTPDPNHGLTCVDCHSQHGRWDSFRNVVDNPGALSDPNDSAPYITYTTGLTFDPNNQADVHQYAALNYDVTYVDFPEPDNTESGYAEWCGGCHEDFHGGATDPLIGGSGSPPSHFERHPVAGVNIGEIGRGHSRTDVFADPNKLNWVKVMSESGTWRPTDPADVVDQTPSCMSCHKGHGNQNAFGLIYMDRFNSGGITEEGTDNGSQTTDQQFKHLCKQCHTQG